MDINQIIQTVDNTDYYTVIKNTGRLSLVKHMKTIQYNPLFFYGYALWRLCQLCQIWKRLEHLVAHNVRWN